MTRSPDPNGRPRVIVRRSVVMREVGRTRPHRIVHRNPGSVPAVELHGVESTRWWSRFRGRISLPVPANRATLALRAAVLGLVVAGIGTLTVWFWQSPLLDVKSVAVIGAETIPPEDIAALADLGGASMFTADLDGARSRIEALPLVRSVSAERRWPNTILVVVEERQPWGTWEQAGVKYAIDRDGMVLGAYAGPAGSPAIVSADPASLRQGDRVSYQAVDAVAEIYERLPRSVGTDALQVAFIPGKGVQVTASDGHVALLGDSSSIAYKLAVWAAAAKEAKDRKLTYHLVDLRWGNRPVLQ